ncbi:hypothetical protein DRE_06293 [Drechslerella stenobrocha 248]|uniref:Ribosomal protein L1 n=1 Tax=Drechslerella stenobrocha 248 TaxID=1043628 RepID=W7HYJ0_9PEZI|nr:hypothetical protein DRE_06293 [Drechslerella stenobrocha 248]
MPTTAPCRRAIGRALAHGATTIASSMPMSTSRCLARASRPSSTFARQDARISRHPIITLPFLHSHAFSTSPSLAAFQKKPKSSKTEKKKKPKTHWKIWNHAEVPKWALMDAVRYIRAFEVSNDPRQMKYDLAVKLYTVKNGPTVKSRVQLPKAVRTDLRICIFAEGKQAELARKAGAAIVGTTEVWEQIKNGKIDFDRCLCHKSVYPAFQKANLGRILGPKGLMPSQKAGTVVGSVADAVTSMIGASEYRERVGVVRIAIGQLSFTAEELRDNIKVFMEALAKDVARIEDYDKRINEVVLSSTHSPGFSLSGEFRSDIGDEGNAALNPAFDLAGELEEPDGLEESEEGDGEELPHPLAE